MSLDPTGRWGIRERLRIALEQGYSFDGLSIIVHVSAETLQAYMGEPTYILAPGDAALIIGHLFDIQAPDVFYDKTTTPYGVIITYVESVWWTDEQLDSVMVPDRATAFKVHYLSESIEHRPSSTPLYSLPDFTPQEIARTAVSGDLSRLLCIVFYEYADIEA